MHYFRKHYKPSSRWGLFELILLGIYARLVFRLPFLAVCRLLDWRHARSKMELQTRQLALLRHPVEHKENQDYIPFEPVMVAGSTGQVGLSIVRRLLAQNMETYGLYHQQVVDYQHPHLHWVQGDVASGFFRNIPDIKVKTLIHTPAIWHLAEHLDYFANLGIKRLICFSSTSIEGKATSENSYEKELVQKFIDAEESIKSQCNKLGIDCTIIRPTMIYGVGLDRNVSSIVKFIQQTGFFPIVKPGTGLRQPVHTDDLAKAVMAILTHPSTYGKTYNLSGGEEISYKDMVHRIFTVMGKKDRTVISPYLPYMLDIYSWVTGNKDTNGEVAKRMNYDLVFEHQEAANDFKYAPRNFLSGNKEDLGLAL